MSNPDRFLLAGVMGWPVMHSRSPILHTYLLRHHRLTGTYVPLAIEPNRLEAALRALAPLGFSGCNVTIPHKAHALTIVDAVDPVAKRIGAVSCVVVQPDGTLAGTNNDAFGFMQNVLQRQPAWRADAGPIVVIGAGGGARAVVYALAERGAREIRLLNRNLERAATVAREFGPPVTAIAWEERHRALDGAGMLVNTTSQGMVGQTPLEITLDALPASCPRVRHRLRSAGNAAPRSRAAPRQSHRRWAGNAAPSGTARVEGLVRHRSRSHAGTTCRSRGDTVGNSLDLSTRDPACISRHHRRAVPDPGAGWRSRSFCTLQLEVSAT